MQSDSIGNLAKALSAAQSEMRAAAMDKQNPFLNSKYADLGSIVEAAKQPLSKNQLCVSQLVGGDGDAISVETILAHASGEWLASEISMKFSDGKGLSHAQGIGSIITYLRRYAYAAIVGLYAEEDTDAQSAQAVKTEQKQIHPNSDSEKLKTLQGIRAELSALGFKLTPIKRDAVSTPEGLDRVIAEHMEMLAKSHTNKPSAARATPLGKTK